MGCTSNLGGNYGIVWFVEGTDNSDLEHILKDGPTPPYVAVLQREHFTRRNLLVFKENPDRVAGVVLLDGEKYAPTSRSSPFSPEGRCPNQYAGLYVNDSQYAGCKENLWQRESPVSGLIYDDIPYPIFLFKDKKTIEDLEQCFTNNNLARGIKREQDSYPLCSMQLDSFMMAAINSQTCLNTHSLLDELFQMNGQRCWTVENQNLFAFFKPAIGPMRTNDLPDTFKPSIVDPKSIVMLTAKLSSFTMFNDVSPGADSTITSIVTLLAAAEALSKVRNDTRVIESNRNIAFAILDSEPFDYTGSSRMTFSMKNNTYPTPYFYESADKNQTECMKNINLDSLDYVIDLDQIANYPNSDTVYLHVDPRDQDGAKFDKLVDVLEQVSRNENVNFRRSSDKLPLPPSSVQEFIKQSQSLSKKEGLLGAVISNYNATYNNLQYHSIYDDSHNIYQTSKDNLVEHISKVASLVAKSLFELAFNDDTTDKIIVNNTLVDNLLDCYLLRANCSVFTSAWQAGSRLPGKPIQTFKSPLDRSNDMNGIITHHLLAYFIGDKISWKNISECYKANKISNSYNFHYVNGQDEPIKDGQSGLCIMSQVLFTSAASPAFALTDEGITVDDRIGPAWSISVTRIRNPPRLFLKPSPIQQWCVFFLGLVVTIVSFLLVYHVKSSIGDIRIGPEIQPCTST